MRIHGWADLHAVLAGRGCGAAGEDDEVVWLADGNLFFSEVVFADEPGLQGLHQA